MSEVALVGIGVAGAATMTCEAADYCRGADVLIGARRMVEAVQRPGQVCEAAYRPEDIAALVRRHTEARRIAVLYSGDTGFYSGAAGLLALLPADTRVLPGISSLSYFAGRLHLSWEDVRVASVHGRQDDVIGLAARSRKTFVLLGDGHDAAQICRDLVRFGLTEVTVYVGERLGYPDERVRRGAPQDFCETQTAPLAVVLLENPHPDGLRASGLSDSAFLRDKVPMTKEEVRWAVLAKLQLTEDAVLYDIGTGTGSVAVEAARRLLAGHVYAVEQNELALQLAERNRLRLAAANMTLVPGAAPAALTGLPAPTHAFLGGTGGQMAEILQCLLEKNARVRVVITAVTLETLTEALSCLQQLPFTPPEVVSLTAARAKEMGRYHMMCGQNPVYILAAEGTACSTT